MAIIAIWAARVPSRSHWLVQVVSFMYRYLFVLVDDVSHMLLARDLRSAGRRKSHLIASAGIIGAMFVRSFEHAERLYEAMLLRGFAGRTLVLDHKHISIRELVISAAFLGLTAAGYIAGRMIYG